MENYINLDDSQAVWYSKDSILLHKEMGYISMVENSDSSGANEEEGKPFILTPKLMKRPRITAPAPTKLQHRLERRVIHAVPSSSYIPCTPPSKRLRLRELPLNTNIRSPALLNPLPFTGRGLGPPSVNLPPFFNLPPPPMEPVKVLSERRFQMWNFNVNQGPIIPCPFPPFTPIFPINPALFPRFDGPIFQNLIVRLPSGLNGRAEDIVGRKLIGVLFAADFCPASTIFFQRMQIFYKTLCDFGKNFEIIWVPGERTNPLQAHAQWPYLNCDDVKVAHFLQYFNITQIPSFQLCTPQGEILLRNGYEDIIHSRDIPQGIWATWKRRFSHRLHML